MQDKFKSLFSSGHADQALCLMESVLSEDDVSILTELFKNSYISSTGIIRTPKGLKSSDPKHHNDLIKATLWQYGYRCSLGLVPKRDYISLRKHDFLACIPSNIDDIGIKAIRFPSDIGVGKEYHDIKSCWPALMEYEIEGKNIRWKIGCMEGKTANHSDWTAMPKWLMLVRLEHLTETQAPLRELNLYSTHINTYDLKGMGIDLSRLADLEVLILSNTKISHLPTIPPNLEYLELRECPSIGHGYTKWGAYLRSGEAQWPEWPKSLVEIDLTGSQVFSLNRSDFPELVSVFGLIEQG